MRDPNASRLRLPRRTSLGRETVELGAANELGRVVL
jgi:hypothetical protein